MKKHKLITIQIISLIITALATTSCATIIGGFTSTKSSSGSSYGPATIAAGDITLQNDKLSALTVTIGDLVLNDFAVLNKTSVFGDLTISDSKLRGLTQVGGNLNSNDSNFYQSCGILGNVMANSSWFARDIEFAGNKLELNNSSKVIGNIISLSKNPVTIIIDHSYIKGSIGFANSNGTVIIRNHGYVKGQIINGSVQDLTGGDSYGGDDDFDEQKAAK